MDVYSFLKASEVLSLDVCKVNEENIDLWNKTYGILGEIVKYYKDFSRRFELKLGLYKKF